ncbi:MAG TPA: hypothetical protein VLL97_04915 [Acidobacteriota bacterium]|nr:hypothetical protein [Acidobacteriota bacterium]
MRVDVPVLPQSLIESAKPLEKKDITDNKERGGKQQEESLSFTPLPAGISGTYSISSLRAAVDYNAKYLTVAENNVEAAKHYGAIPQVLIDHFK